MESKLNTSIIGKQVKVERQGKKKGGGICILSHWGKFIEGKE